MALELSVGLASRRPQTDGVPPIVALPDGSPDADRRVDAVVIGVEAVVHGLPADGYQRADLQIQNFISSCKHNQLFS